MTASGMDKEETPALAARLVGRCRAAGLRVATAESCTGGLVAAAITDVPGSSEMFERGIVAYANAAKIELLGVPEATIAGHGAVSRETAQAMAAGLLARAPVDLAVSVTGVAGPGGGTAEKPVGLVHLALARRDGPTRAVELRFGALSRAEIRERSVAVALGLLLDAGNGDQAAG